LATKIVKNKSGFYMTKYDKNDYLKFVDL